MDFEIQVSWPLQVMEYFVCAVSHRKVVKFLNDPVQDFAA